MNKSRELFLLFQPDNVNTLLVNYRDELKQQGYTIIHCHSFPNDEPPYIMVTFYGIATPYDLTKNYYDEDEETSSFYLIRNKDVTRFISLMNEAQKDYCDYYIEGVLTRNAGEYNMSPKEYADSNNIYSRRHKIKHIDTLPNSISLFN